jgi:hypothetical protein
MSSKLDPNLGNITHHHNEVLSNYTVAMKVESEMPWIELFARNSENIPDFLTVAVEVL